MFFSSGDYFVQQSRTARRSYKECHYKLYEIISNFDQEFRRRLCFKYFLSRALVAILVGRADSNHLGIFRSLRITTAEVILRVHHYGSFNIFSHFFIILSILVILLFKYFLQRTLFWYHVCFSMAISS